MIIGYTTVSTKSTKSYKEHTPKNITIHKTIGKTTNNNNNQMS